MTTENAKPSIVRIEQTVRIPLNPPHDVTARTKTVLTPAELAERLGLPGVIVEIQIESYGNIHLITG